MLRAEAGGVAIELELWALPTGQVGAFMAGIPAPLSIGTVSLSDGTSCKGFLVEVAAVRGAEDISGFGGWRGYLARRAQGGQARSAAGG
jgi:allophanate hydrolase